VRPIVVDWDLSARHTIAEVNLPEQDLDTDLTELTPIQSVRIRFPGGKVFQLDYEVHNVTLEREGRIVSSIQVDTHPITADEAYTLSLKVAAELGVPTEQIEDWHQKRLAGSAQGREGPLGNFDAIGPEGWGGPGGPQPGVKLLSSFDDERPAIVSVQFSW
jgi:hypothetical protein